jgi:uncharacterized protein
MTTDALPAEIVKQTLRADLRAAMRAREALRVRVLRDLIAALDNAEAVPLGERHERYVELAFGDPAAQAQRLSLTEADVTRVLETEAESRRTTAADLETRGQTARAAELLTEAALVARYVRR